VGMVQEGCRSGAFAAIIACSARERRKKPADAR
jgi:hypothetical protein